MSSGRLYAAGRHDADRLLLFEIGANDMAKTKTTTEQARVATKAEKAEERMLDHYNDIIEREMTVRAAQIAWEHAKEEAHAAKKLYDAQNDALLDMIHDGPDWQLKIEFHQDDE